MIDGAAIVTAARAALGTPVHHEGRLCGVGLDCVGLVAHAFERCGLPYTDGIPYSTTGNGARLLRTLALSLVEIPAWAAAAGDVLVFWIRKPVSIDEPRHVAIMTPADQMIHSYARLGSRGEGPTHRGRVQEHEITPLWRKRLHSVWRHPRLMPAQTRD